MPAANRTQPIPFYPAPAPSRYKLDHSHLTLNALRKFAQGAGSALLVFFRRRLNNRIRRRVICSRRAGDGLFVSRRRYSNDLRWRPLRADADRRRRLPVSRRRTVRRALCWPRRRRHCDPALSARRHRRRRARVLPALRAADRRGGGGVSNGGSELDRKHRLFFPRRLRLVQRDSGAERPNSKIEHMLQIAVTGAQFTLNQPSIAPSIV